MKLKFRLNTNSLQSWFRPCYYCKHKYIEDDDPAGVWRECLHPSNPESEVMICYDEHGVMRPNVYQVYFTKIEIKKL